jgi:succinate-semialdehyde dehydrogenase/glutarate-semialdehyde dehydrogenase
LPYASVNPATGDFIVQFAYTSEAQLAAALARADRVFRYDWSIREAADRASVLRDVARGIRLERHQLSGFATLEMGKLATEALLEVDAAADIFDRHADDLLSLSSDRQLSSRLPDSLDTPAAGVVVCIETWNFPFFELARVVAPNLAVGNTVMVQHSKAVPLCAAAFERIVTAAGLPAGAFATLFLPAGLVDRAMMDERVRGVTVHGLSTSLAARAMAAGKPVRLTGRTPAGTDVFAVLEDADLELAVKLAVEARMANCGQMCSGAKRFLVMNAVADEFSERLREAMLERAAGDPADPAVTLGPVSGRSVLDHALDMIDQAQRNGARAVTGGRRIDRPGFYLEPTILVGVTEQNPVYGAEIFAPVAVIVRVRDDAEVVAVANRRPAGIGGSVLTRDIERAFAIARQVDHGTLCVNATALSRKPASVLPGPQGGSLSELPVHPFVRTRQGYLAW